jgi:hypothetical protein
MATKRGTAPATSATAPPAIHELVEKFAEHRETYQRGVVEQRSAFSVTTQSLVMKMGGERTNERQKLCK